VLKTIIERFPIIICRWVYISMVLDTIITLTNIHVEEYEKVREFIKNDPEARTVYFVIALIGAISYLTLGSIFTW